MAARTVVTLIDDLDGHDVGPDGRSIAFSFDGIDYQIDLGMKNATRFEKAIGPFVDAATRVGGRKGRSKSSARRPAGDTDTQAIREWARENGYEVSDRGRISRTVLQAWKEAS